jgi:hypothetical protein
LVWVIFSLEVIIIDFVHLPVNLTFYNFAFHDEGSNLTLQFLLAHGLRPVIDFGFFYGLLTLPIEHLWFSITGLTPYGYQEAMLAVGLAMGWACARFASSLQISRAGVLLMAAALPIAVRSSYGNFSGAVEAALLCNAVAEHAGGHRRVALTLAGIACLIKAALGYFYVLLLIALATKEFLRSSRPLSALWHLLFTPGIIGGTLLLLLGLRYGWQPLLWTQFPVRGAQTYRYLNDGIFRAGRVFYYFPGVHVGYYFGTIAGFYLYATLCVFVAGIIAARRLISCRDDGSLIADEVMVACAILHGIFLFGLFGNASSWAYYSYILVMGMVLAPRYFNRVAPYVAAMAIALAVLSNKTDFETIYKAWRLTSRSPATAGLWASRAEVQEWLRVDKTIGPEESVVLSWAGCAFLLDKRLEPRPALYALPFQSNDREIERYASQIKAARFIVARANLDFVDFALKFPRIKQAGAAHQPLWQGQYFEVFRRQ